MPNRENVPTQTLVHDLHRRFVNPDFIELLEAFDFGRRFVKASGTRLYDETGREYRDFLAGFGVHNIGHNHPRLIRRLHEALDSQAPSMLNIDAPAAAGRLAEKLSGLAHPSLCRTAFANSGAEAVDIALKAARVATGRDRVLVCRGGYHGLSVGALSLLDRPSWREPFGDLLVKAEWVPFNDLPALESALKQQRPAAFFVEPVQAEGGIRVPKSDYLTEAAQLCRRAGCLFVADEIQTGLGRTGEMFATRMSQVLPDILLLGKALSGGMIPAAAALMTEPVWKKAFSGPERCHLNSSTFAGGSLAMITGLETIAVIEDEKLCAAADSGDRRLAQKLAGLAARHSIVASVRGRGLLYGIEFKPAEGLLMKAVPEWAREGLYAQVICALLLRDHAVIAQPCSLKQDVLRIEPPLTVSESDIDAFVCALDQALAACPSHKTALASAFKKRLGGRL